MTQIKNFFYPNSIAVIGATANSKKFGNAVTINILENDQIGIEIYLVSHGSKKVCGKKTYESILDIDQDIDIAIILVPAKYIDQVVDQCIEKKVKGIIIVTAGFGEIGEKGKAKERKIAEKCRNSGIRLMGPNCVGIQNVDIGLNASFIQLPPHGHISMISQSGSFGCACFYEMERENLGCSKFANLGNKVDVSFDEIINYFNEDENTRIISIYMETVANGREFFKILEKINFNKPIVILKGGKSKIGMEAASSHTGSIATDYKLLKTAILQAGATICEDISDFMIALKAFTFLPLPMGKKVGVLTNSGGSSVLFSDNAEKFNLEFAEFSNNLKEKVSEFLIPLVKLVNPLDMIAGAGEKQYYEVTKAMLEDDNIDIVVGCCVIPPFLEMKTDEHYKGMIRAWNETGRKKPLLPLMLFSEDFEDLKNYAEKENSPVFYTPHEAAYAVKVLIDRVNNLKKSRIKF